MNIFEQAVRLKLRFATVRGPITVEDLFDIPLQNARDKFNLDDIAITAAEELRALEMTPTSFVKKTSSAAARKHDAAALRLEILKAIIAEKMAASEKAAETAARISKRRMLEDVLASKREAGLRDMSVEELEKQIADLND